MSYEMLRLFKVTCHSDMGHFVGLADNRTSWEEASRRVMAVLVSAYGSGIAEHVRGIEDLGSVRIEMPTPSTRTLALGLKQFVDSEKLDPQSQYGEMLLDTCVGIARENGRLFDDIPEYDGTDAAHPAYWRGEARGVAGACEQIEKVLIGSGNDLAGKYKQPLQRVREQVAALVRLRAGLLDNGCEIVEKCDDGTGPWVRNVRAENAEHLADQLRKQLAIALAKDLTKDLQVRVQGLPAAPLATEQDVVDAANKTTRTLSESSK